jgi:hypothetical protein
VPDTSLPVTHWDDVPAYSVSAAVVTVLSGVIVFDVYNATLYESVVGFTVFPIIWSVAKAKTLDADHAMLDSFQVAEAEDVAVGTKTVQSLDPSPRSVRMAAMGLA